MKDFIRIKFSVFALLIIAVGLLSACSVNKPFVLMDDQYHLKPTRVAVIAASNDEADRVFADMLTDALKEHSSLKVMSQKDIAKRIPKYPFDINFRYEDNGKQGWYDPAAKKKINSIQAKLKTDYLFVVWVRNLNVQWTHYSGGGSSTNYSLTVFGNMLEYPGGKVISYSQLDRKAKPSLLRGTIFKKESYFIEAMLKDAARRIALRVKGASGPGAQAAK